MELDAQLSRLTLDVYVTSQGFIPENKKWERDELLKRKQNTSLLHANVYLNLANANFFILLETRCQLLAS